jgi:carbon storage regulator
MHLLDIFFGLSKKLTASGRCFLCRTFLPIGEFLQAKKLAREFLWKRDWGSLSLIESFKTKETSSMLVLSRKQSQRIRVGDSVIVTVVRVSGDKVRIGIEAPSNIRVLRDELEFDDQIELPMTPRPIGKAF